MSPYRALEVINKEIESGRQAVSVNKALRAAEVALKKQIPQRPVKDEYGHNICPSCRWIISYDEGWGEKYVPCCENCGQAIKWEKEDME